MGISQIELKRKLYYDPETGNFYHKKSGKLSGSLKFNKYISVGINYKGYFAHRLAFLYMEGKFPEEDVDHINGNRSDNRWVNLRCVSRSQNLKNRGGNVGRELPKNVYLHKGNLTKPYKVKIKIEGITRHFGYYSTVQEAVEAATLARTQYHGAYARHV